MINNRGINQADSVFIGEVKAEDGILYGTVNIVGDRRRSNYLFYMGCYYNDHESIIVEDIYREHTQTTYEELLEWAKDGGCILLYRGEGRRVYPALSWRRTLGTDRCKW